MKTVLLALLAFALRGAMAQPLFPTETIAPRVQIELANTTAPDSTLSRLLACVSVLPSGLTFLPAIQGFEAEYEIVLEVLNVKSETVATREATTRLYARDLTEARSSQRYSFHRFVFDFPPGEYSVRLAVLDRVSNLRTDLVTTKALRSFNSEQTSLVLSDAIWLERASGEESNYAPMLFANATNPDRELALYLEVRSRDLQTPLHVQQTIRNARQEIVLQQQRVWPRTGAIERLLLPLGTELLPYGSYAVEMLIQQDGRGQRAVANFRLAWDNVPATALHLNHALGAAKYVATEEERHALQTAVEQISLAEKQNALRKFWQARDTTNANGACTSSASFYQRLLEAEDKFGGEKPGWQTDLGRVYLTHGAPDEIEIHTKATATQPFQVWRYHARQLEFLFVDRKGLGLYQLASRED